MQHAGEKMSDETFNSLEQIQQTDGAVATLQKLCDTLREQKEHHRLFDALLMQKKQDLGISLLRPTSFDDVPEEHRENFEKHYVDSARQVGHLLLEDSRLADAWVSFQTIREPEPVREVLDKVSMGGDFDDRTEELINVALYEGAHPVKGLELMLNTHGTCNTITTLDQQIMQLSEEDRRSAAALLVNQIYGDLCHTLKHEISQRLPVATLGNSLRELITGERDWLFSEGNYHIDVSHLNAVVRFARSLTATDPELALSIELAEYGTRLDPQFQYAGEAPFEDFYPAHKHFLSAVLDVNRDEAIAFFRSKLDTEPDAEDKQMIAYVLVDLLQRIDRTDEAIDLANEFLADVDESSGFSFAGLCLEAGRLDVLKEAARSRGDLVAWTAALLDEGTTSTTAAAAND